ncbi:Alpha-protein kinase 3 [Merluccius polli]|uniref:non-specific serine/threonine protein kinase n=1 Tax=Merluccius polli TaxID=89951 RepID=A0AA47P955_MERPO|nr:Alpha-protein kinase 3 [Merluccius polli]
METSLFPLFPKVTQAHARPNRTSPPVGLKPPAPHCAVDAPLPQRTPSEGETMTAGGQTAEVQASSARRPVQGTRRAAKDHSRGSSERNSVPFTDPVAFLEESLRYGQSSPGCSVSHAVKTEEGLEIPVERKVEGHQAGTLQVCEDRQALSQMKVEMEADVVAMKEIERAQIGATLDESQRETVFITHAGVSQTEMNNEPVLKSTVETHPIMHKTNITGVDTSNEQVTMEPGKINVRDTNVSEQQMNPLKEAHKPGPNVLSVAEIMRSQIKALESTLSNPLTVESNSVTVESIASTPHIALSTEKVAAPGKFPDLREDLEKGHDMERVLAIEIEQKIETKPPEQPPKSTPPTTEPITSFSIPPYRGEDNVTAQDVERTIEKEQRVEAMPVSTPEVPDTAGKQVGLQPRLNPPECTPEQPQTKPQTPTAQTTEAITSFSRGALGTRLDVERPIDIKQKIETKTVSTPEVPDTAGKQVGLQPRLNPPECTPEQPQTKPQAPAAQTTEAITSFSRGALGTRLDVERPIDIKQKIETKPVSTPEVPDATAKQFGFKPRINPTEYTPEQPQTKPQTPAAQTTEAITSFSRGALGTGLDVERPIDIKQKIETKPVSTPEVPDAAGKQVGLQPRLNPPESTPEQLQTKPQTPAAQTTKAITSFSRGALGTGLDVERPIDIKQKIATKPVSTPEVPDATGKQVGLQPRLNPPECTPEQPQTPTAPTTEAITCYSRGEDLGKELNVERPIEIESKMDTKSVSTPEVPDTTAKQFEFQPTIYQQTTIECTPNQPLTPTAPTSEAIIAFSIPPISVSDTESMAETGNTSSRMENDSIVDTGHACGTSSPVSLGDSPDPPPAAATDEMTTITCCSNASLMEVDFKDLTDSNSSVIMSQEHRKSLSSGETGMYSVVELCCTEDSEKAGPSSEQHSPKQSILDPSSTDEGFKQIPPPEIKLNSESHLKSTPVLSPTCVDAQKTTELNRSTVEIKQDDMIQQERNLFISIIEPTTTAIAPPTSSSNDEAPLQEVKSDAPTVPSATPKDLALGARRKIFTPKSKTVEDNPTTPTPVDSQPQSEEVLPKPSKAPPAPATLSVPPGPAQQTLLDVEPNGQRTPPVRRRSPLLSRKVTAQETLQQTQAPRSEEKSAEKEKHDPLKAATERQDRLDMDRIPCQLQESRECETPVIRKIRGESFSDASGHLKLWCQFFNVLSDSVISWYMDDVEIAQVKRSAGDETPVNLAIIQASKKDCGVYGCKITNDHGTDITDLLLSIEILGGMRLREDLGVGEEIEMAPLLLNKGVADCGVWGSKFFGRVMVQESHIGGGCSRKTWRAKVVYGLEPVFESGTTCVIKMCNRITYGGKGEAQLTERNKCRIQSLAREYCKIFSAESRLIENFGPCLEVIPVYLMYRPANTVPYATVEADLKGVYLKYCKLRAVAGLVSRTGSEVELKCCALQHWIYQWTNGNLLLTQLEGRMWRSTDHLFIFSTQYQGLSVVGNPAILEQFVSQHQCNYYCGLLSLRSLKTTDSLQMPSSKSRGSKSPSLQRKTAAGAHSPQTARRAAVSPRLPRKADGGEQDKSQSPMKQKELHATNVLS